MHLIVESNRIVWHFGHGYHERIRFSQDDMRQYCGSLGILRITLLILIQSGSHKNILAKSTIKVLIVVSFQEIHEARILVMFGQCPTANLIIQKKTEHPCQYPVALIERLVLALTNEGDLVVESLYRSRYNCRGCPQAAATLGRLRHREEIFKDCKRQNSQSSCRSSTDSPFE